MHSRQSGEIPLPSVRHGSARFGAAVARIGTVLAMLCLMGGALIPAGLTDVSTNAAQGMGVRAATGHRSGGGLANCRAFDVECDALGHHLYVILCKTGRGAMVASHDTSVAG